jgi:hypothetical protein
MMGEGRAEIDENNKYFRKDGKIKGKKIEKNSW